MNSASAEIRPCRSQERLPSLPAAPARLGARWFSRLVRDGAAVHVPCIVKAELEDCRKTLGEVFAQATIHEANVAREAEVEKLFAAVASKSGRLDVLANIVGGFAFAALSETIPRPGNACWS